MNDKDLVLTAFDAMKMAYAPYSGYKVGAALLGASGKVYTGCNIENAAYGPTNCAERTAFFKAVSGGEREFTKIAVVGGKEGNAEEFCTPCGVCRQVMLEFCNRDSFLVIFGKKDGFETHTLAELTPFSFGKDDLN
jgi:cytidine deaminase